MHAESLVRAENQPQQATTTNANESVTMMDLTRDGNICHFSFLSSIFVR